MSDTDTPAPEPITIVKKRTVRKKAATKKPRAKKTPPAQAPTEEALSTPAPAKSTLEQAMDLLQKHLPKDKIKPLSSLDALKSALRDIDIESSRLTVTRDWEPEAAELKADLTESLALATMAILLLAQSHGITLEPYLQKQIDAAPDVIVLFEEEEDEPEIPSDGAPEIAA